MRLATRQSPLALWQAEQVATLLRRAHPNLTVELVPMSTRGDRVLDRSLAAIGGKGLFVKELELALIERRADIAVHSMKDMPGELADELTIGAVLERADARDALITAGPRHIGDLVWHARVGTSSLRRQAQLLAARPDLRIEPLRGNVETRLQRLADGNLDAIVLACAGLMRLGLESRITSRLDMTVSLPAVGQGVIGVECRADDSRSRELLKPLEHAATRIALDAERAFSRRLGGSCQSPIAGHAELARGGLTLDGLVAEPDGSRLFRDSISGAAHEAQVLGERLAERVLAAGAGALLERLRTA